MAVDLRSMRVLVTPTSYAKHDPRLRSELEAVIGTVIYNPYPRPLTSEELQGFLPDIDGYIAGVDAIDHAAIESATRLKVIARYGVGVDNVDLAAARERGIRVTNTPGANASAVAELAAGLMLSLARQIPQSAQSTREGGWMRLQGRSIQGRTVGLLGFGAVGREVARMLSGFNCEILAFDPLGDPAAAAALTVRLTTQDEVVASADFLSLHLPVTAETRGIVDARFITRMKAGSYLINTARGELIDDSALVAALSGGHLAGAALDCFAVEPPPPDNPLLKLPNVIATPHTGANTDAAANAMGWGALQNCLAVLRGEAPINPVV